jgi:GWxTD domain-containing protein
MRLVRSFFLFSAFALGLLWTCGVAAQDAPAARDDGALHQLSPKQRQKRDKKLVKELGNAYERWLQEDAIYIITKEEREAFLRLSTNEERDQFTEHFFDVRNPEPESGENRFKEEHYRRIAYANEHFASGVPGWKTDRGHMYIVWGPPDEIESHPTGGTYDRPAEEGGGSTSTYPWEKWRYRHLDEIGENIELEFVDPSGSGEYHLTMDPGEKDALAKVPGAGPSLSESLRLSTKGQRLTNTDGTTLPAPLGSRPASMNEFERLKLNADVQRPPRFKDLATLVTMRFVRDQIHLDYSLDYLRITGDSVLVPITLQVRNRDLEFHNLRGVESATLDVYARISTMTGRVVQTFEDTVSRDFPESLFQNSLKLASIYQKAVPLRPGLYRLDVVVKDEASGKVGTIGTALRVPRYDEENLDASSLILADQIEAVPTNQLGLGPFVIGARKVRPRLGKEFASAEKMGVFVQFYNLKLDDTTHKTSTDTSYRITKGGQEVWRTEQHHQNGEQLSVEQMIPLAGFAPGRYTLEVRTKDQTAGQAIERSAEFTIKGDAQDAARKN